jgi:putative redox protein
MSTTKILGSATAENSGVIYTTAVTSGDEVFTIDEPMEFGGQNAGRSPADYLCMSLASCKAITIRMYANRKGWKLDKVTIKSTLVKGDDMPSGKNTFFCSINVSGNLDEEQLKRILQIAKICPIDRLLTKSNEVVTVLE